MRRVQTEVRNKIREGKEQYRRKLKSKLAQNNTMEKFSTIMGCITGAQEVEYSGAVASFVERCGHNHLQLKIGNTKELRGSTKRVCRTMRQMWYH
ncbi:hypothetical protein CRENBAI_000843 [Crenichthys baileyi]|uniref:Uncharacterized protein n=1 Tax=Crenichthys baileyi TaxID=28760 RepID=A0AAV9RKT8_9TELE